MNPVIWRAGTIILWPITYLLLRTRRVGANRVPATGATLIVCNHLANVDPPLVGMMALPRRVHFMAKAELFRWRWSAFMMRSVGSFPVERGAGDRDAIRYAREVLRSGGCLIMFPEGTRSITGRLRPFFPGAGVLGLEPGVTVIPAAIWGTQRHLGPVRVIFGDPLDLSDIPPAAKSVRAKEATRRMAQAICELVPQIGGPPQVVAEGEPSFERG